MTTTTHIHHTAWWSALKLPSGLRLPKQTFPAGPRVRWA